MSDFTNFFRAMRVYCPEHARILACQFRGDPHSDQYGKWRARVLNTPQMIDDKANVYLCVSAMQKNSRGEYRRRKENFAGGLLLMIDDIGDGPGAKFPFSVIDPLAPTCWVETSPRNFQAFYFFDRCVDDLELFDALINAFIRKQFLGADPGSAGVNRVFRPPAGVNGKPAYAGWAVTLHEWHPERRYSVEDIARAYDLELIKPKPVPRDMAMRNAHKAERIRHFMEVRQTLRAAGMVKREEPDYSGWVHIQCPWLDEHTARADTGAAIRLPAEDNDWYGAFRCHHGHCEGRGWRELTEWLNDAAAELCERVNALAPAWGTIERLLLEQQQ